MIKHKKSLYTVYDLLGDVGGLLDLFTLFMAFFLTKYNYSLFLYNSIHEMFTFPSSPSSNEPLQYFSTFLYQSICSCLLSPFQTTKSNETSPAPTTMYPLKLPTSTTPNPSIQKPEHSQIHANPAATDAPQSTSTAVSLCEDQI